MKIHEIEYDNMPLATVEINESKAAEPIKEMVEFWMGWEKNIEDNDGDYTRTWLVDLATFILRQQRLPNNNDEGWYPLDGSCGISIKSWEPWEHDEDLITITSH